MAAPKRASGTDPSRMMKGSRKLLNCAASTRKMRTTASRKTPPNLSAFNAELTRTAGIIDDITGGQNLVRFVLEKLQGGIDRAGRNAADSDGV